MHDLSSQCKSVGSPGHGQTGEGNFGEGLVRLSVNRVIYTLSILTFLDRYGTGTVPLHLSASVNVSLIPYRSVPIRNPVFCGARSGTNCSGIVRSAQFVMCAGGSVPFRSPQFVMWTGGSVPFRNRYGRTRFRTDPNCTGMVCTCTVPLQMWTG